MENLYPRGSEWRKWDLHVHTPASELHNGFGSDWDVYVKNLFKTLIEKEISVVGITDYFSIEGYKKIKEEYLESDVKLAELFSLEEIEKIKKILVIPNIEFRSDKFTNEGSINFHILFSEAVTVKEIEEKFLHDISFRHEADPNEADKEIKLSKANLEEHGVRLKNEDSSFDGTDLYVGLMTAVVDESKILGILQNKKNIFGGKFLFTTEANEELSSIDWAGRDHQARKLFLKKSNLLFSANKKTRSWGLGQKPYQEGKEKFIKEFKTLKPCIHGSDAHTFKFIGHPCSKRGDASHDCSKDLLNCELQYCWVKADPTFEGLKQILYEPEDRVVIQPENPTPVKSSQSILSFSINETEIETELKFKDTKINLNEGLVAITGGKGGGKTALVDLIANIYEDRVFCKDKNSFVKRIAENKNPTDLKTTIELQNNEEFSKEIKEALFIEGASIVYLAQGELEKHLENPTYLERYINDLIFESNEIKDSELLFDYQNINDEVLDLHSELTVSNQNIFVLEDQTDSKVEENFKKEVKNLETDLKDAEKRIFELAKSLSAEKIKEAEEKQKQLTDLRDKKDELTQLGITVKDALKFTDESIKDFNEEVSRINILAEKLEFPQRFESVQYSDGEELRNFIILLRQDLRKTIGEIEKFQKDLEEKEKGIKEHAKLLDKKKELEKEIKKTNDKLILIGENKKTLIKELEARGVLFEKLLNKRIEQRDKYLSIISAFSKNKNDILNDLEFTSELVFDETRFLSIMSELVDLRKIKIQDLGNGESDISFFIEAIDDLIQNPSIEKAKNIATIQTVELLNKVVPNQKKAETISRRTIYDAIFDDYLSVAPSVRYKKVKLQKLSLGQKATVLIKIYLAQGENPIIIDSHDDHLDNEFIMDELVKALRQAKKYRQIIIVSNNGNVVVNSDAEQVIIACRDDQGEISYISGSLEDPNLRPKLLNVLEGGEEAFDKRRNKYRISV